ncbi:hypothetical protein [Nitrolancea hollandica]|uniref:Uncharacterized protein n=1 Tax=Nitrolancea hollandica Lb TaxID=1129897 RepID=I4EHM5_9BACT|nr:hypothetical protein [Nitrolancea hollandica]CCF84187.1 conserved hypothetical protein [Nitrolancea hollandica Lb]
MASEDLLYIWLDADPLVQPPDVVIEDTPGVSDIQLVARAIAEGRLGRLLPPKIAISTHERPNFNGYRKLDVARLLQEYQIANRRRFEIFPTDPS